MYRIRDSVCPYVRTLDVCMNARACVRILLPCGAQVVGIKVDRGLTVIPGTEGENSTQVCAYVHARAKSHWNACLLVCMPGFVCTPFNMSLGKDKGAKDAIAKGAVAWCACILVGGY